MDEKGFEHRVLLNYKVVNTSLYFSLYGKEITLHMSSY